MTKKSNSRQNGDQNLHENPDFLDLNSNKNLSRKLDKRLNFVIDHQNTPKIPKSCENCIFFLKKRMLSSSDSCCYCRRYPKLQEVFYRYWCGEYRHNVENKDIDT